MLKGLFITVNYRSWKLTESLLINLSEMQQDADFEIAVADNTESSEDFFELEKSLNNHTQIKAKLLKTSGNIGYYGAADFVMKQYDTKLKEFDYIIISNNDIEINDKEFFNKLNKVIEGNSVIAPDIFSSVSRNHQNPIRRISISRWQKMQYRLLYTNYYFGSILHYSRLMLKVLFKSKTKNEVSEGGTIYAAHGSFIIFTRKYFEAGGIIDHDYFLYGEEDTVAAQCRDLSLSIYFCPELVVIHNEHHTTGGDGFKKRIYKHQKNAYQYIKNKYPGYF